MDQDANQNQNDPPDHEVDGHQQGRVNTVQIKIPPFWKADPDLWFIQIEAQFATAGIRADLSKYNQIVGKLDTDTLTAVSDIVKNPPANDKYQTLKNRLTNQFTESDRKKLKILFNDLTIGDEKPSTLLRKMKDKSCGKVGNDLLLELWTNRLPQQIQAILSCSNEPLDQQVIMADKIYETIDHTSINALSGPSDFTKQICQLEDKIDSLQREINRSRSHNRYDKYNRSPSRSTHNSRSNPDHCWYHQHFHDKAKKCDPKMDPPCSYKTDKNKSKSKN